MSEGSESDRLVFVKLGGSLITDKRRAEAVRTETLAGLAGEIADVSRAMPGRLVVGHGSGSFGHRAAEDSGFLESGGRRGPDAVATVQDAAARLHRIVVRALLEAGAAPFSVVPGSAFTTTAGAPRLEAADLCGDALAAGLLPVLYGDVVLGSAGTAVILSTETIFLTLIRHMLDRGAAVERVLWLGETAGVLGTDGAVIPSLTASEARVLAEDVGPAAGVDVTGGMRLRLETAAALAEIGVVSVVLDGRVPGLVQSILRGSESAGTRVEPD